MAAKTDSNSSPDVYLEFEKFGRYHFIQYVLVCLPLMMVSMIHVNYIFVAEDVDHRNSEVTETASFSRDGAGNCDPSFITMNPVDLQITAETNKCLVPECEDANPTVDLPVWWPNNVDAKCFRPVVDMREYNKSHQTCSNNTFVEILEDCHEWIYENTNSIVSELNLGCHSWKSTLVGSLHNAGMVMSMIITGWISDKVGRKPTIIVCSIGGAIGLAKIFVKNYYAYLGVEFFESVLASGLYTVAVVLLIEVGGEPNRVLAGVIFSYAVYVGEVLFAFIAMGLKYWKTLILVVYTPMVLFVTYIIILKEGTRWQMLRGRTEEAKETLKFTARMNKINVSAEEIDELSAEDLRFKFNVVMQKEKESIKDILASRETMLRLIVTSFCFFTSSFVYYGLAVHSVLLPGNKYTNFVLTSLASFPGDLLALYTFKKYGRKISLQCGYVCSAIFLIAQTYTPDSLSWLKILLFLCGKLGVVVCFTGIYTYSLELFPTSVRGTLVGVGNTAARLGSMLAPLTPLLTSELNALPSILFSSTAIVAALLLSITPETMNLPLFDTIAQIETYKSKVMTHL